VDDTSGATLRYGCKTAPVPGDYAVITPHLTRHRNSSSNTWSALHRSQRSRANQLAVNMTEFSQQRPTATVATQRCMLRAKTTSADRLINIVGLHILSQRQIIQLYKKFCHQSHFKVVFRVLYICMLFLVCL